MNFHTLNRTIDFTICDDLLCIEMYAFYHVVLFLWSDIYLSPTLNFRLLRASKDSFSEHDSGAYIEIETSEGVKTLCTQSAAWDLSYTHP